MRFLYQLFLVTSIGLILMSFQADKGEQGIYQFTVQDILGNDIKMSNFKGKVLLIVNVASKCNNTPQYADLQNLYDLHYSEGFEILGFPANNFLNQEPGTNEEINSFCTINYGVTFPMFSKISVKGKKQHPLYEYLTDKKKNGKLNANIKWNFQKFLISREGEILATFKPKEKVTDPAVRKKIERAIRKK